MNTHVIWAIFRRNFISYFSNPTGYVFICVFVAASSMAAFWPSDFFNSNLANLDQLNRYLPYILLIFVPAITMSIWAEERRQGTDELLLTIPATDFDVVLGKYLAAVAIYSASLLFSWLSNFYVLSMVGAPDLGLLFSTYVGYLVVGVAMVSIGMVASFLTGNLTVGFVLGVLFNVPLVFAGSADMVMSNPDLIAAINGWSIASQFRDFSRGVLSLSSLAYFLGIVALMLYLCMVLIGRRHWRGGRDGRGVATHYFLRFLALLAIVASIDVFLWKHNRIRADISSEQVSSLSPATRQLLNKIEPKSPINVYAYVSNDMPENYIQAKLNLLSTLDELKAAAGDKIEVHTYAIDPLSEEATHAEQQYNIRPEKVSGRNHGSRTPEDIFMGVAVTCGLEKVVLPFLNKGLPPEYELMRAISTVSKQKRKKVGVLMTDAKLYGGFEMSNMSQTPNQAIIEDLQKQYDLVQVDPANPITDRYDVLLAVQPSSLAPGAMENFIEAVRSGQPTAIFEDPFPYVAPEVPGTVAPKRPPGGMPFMMQRQPPQPKGDVSKLWRTLGINFNGSDVVWQNYNPYPRLRDIGAPKEFVFVKSDVMHEPFNESDPISSKTQELLFLFPGSMSGVKTSPLQFTPLVTASFKEIGLVPYDQITVQNPFGGGGINPRLRFLERQTGDRYVLAARITGKLKDGNLPMSDKSADEETDDDDAMPADHEHDHDEADHDHAHDHEHEHEHGHAKVGSGVKSAPVKPTSGKSSDPEKEPEINVVVVSDIDCLFSLFFDLRQRGSEDTDDTEFHMENVSFVLNVLDSLAGDESLIEIRKHRPVHKTLDRVLDKTKPKKLEEEEAKQRFNKECEEASAKARSEFKSKLDELDQDKELTRQERDQRRKVVEIQGQQRLNQSIKVLEQKRDRAVEQKRRELAVDIRAIQDTYKWQGVLLPPILPLAIAFFVYFHRRSREREGVNKTRLRS